MDGPADDPAGPCYIHGMLPSADTHVHLLAGLDDGPRDADEARAMARMLVAEGCRFATALAHQNPHYPDNTPDRLRAAAADLAAQLAAQKIPLTVYPSAEVMLGPDTLAQWRAGKLLSLGGHGKHLLVEMPHEAFLDVRPLAAALRADGVRLVIAHAERYSELLHDPRLADAVIEAGCLIQVSSGELADPSNAADARALKDWATRGVIHLLGSDGHRLGGREPRMRAGVEALAKWAGRAAADRIASIWGSAVLQGHAVNPPKPITKPRSWFGKLFG
jgi:protein-tyrosine phosphatase